MWLSKLVLDPRSKAARRDLLKPYELHRTLSRAVSPGIKEGRERLLWRLEPVRAHERPVVLVQTLTRPDWDVLEEGYADVFPPKQFQPQLRPGDVFRFRVRANPVKRARDTGKRVALKTREEKFMWLARRLDFGGFHLVGADIWQDSYLQARKEDLAIQLQAVLFEGLLRVKDPDRALETLARGIGPGKALGLGLLSIKRP
jgi:CRISPR system Cascade subunit CasE